MVMVANMTVGFSFVVRTIMMCQSHSVLILADPELRKHTYGIGARHEEGGGDGRLLAAHEDVDAALSRIRE